MPQKDEWKGYLWDPGIGCLQNRIQRSWLYPVRRYHIEHPALWNDRISRCTPSHCVEDTNHRVSTISLGLRRRGFPGSSHGIVELVPRDQVATINVIATSDSRSGTGRYRGWAVVLLKPSEMLVTERYLIHTVKDCAV